MAASGDEQSEQGCALYGRGNLDGAISALCEALRLNPDHADARYNLAVALSESGHSEEAVAEWRETVRRHPDYWQAHENLGYVFFQRAREKNRRRDWRAARDAYRQVLAVRPDDVTLLYCFSEMAWKSGDRQAALASAQRAVEADPHSAELLWRLGQCQVRMGHWRGAWQTASASVSLTTYDKPRHPTKPAHVFPRIVLPLVLLVSTLLIIHRLSRR